MLFPLNKKIKNFKRTMNNGQTASHIYLLQPSNGGNSPVERGHLDEDYERS